MLSLEQILEVEEWAMSELQISEPDILWMVKMADTFKGFGHFDQAVERSNKARQMDSKDWRAPFCLDQVLNMKGHYKEALEMAETVMDMFKNDDTPWKSGRTLTGILSSGSWQIKT